MNCEQTGLITTVEVSEAVYENTAAMIDTSNTTNTKIVCKTATAGAQVVGIFKEDIASGYKGKIALAAPIVFFKVAGNSTAISEGDYLIVTTGGHGIKSTTDRDKIVGIALAPSAASGDVIPILFAPAERSTS